MAILASRTPDNAPTRYSQYWVMIRFPGRPWEMVGDASSEQAGQNRIESLSWAWHAKGVRFDAVVVEVKYELGNMTTEEYRQ